MLPAPRATSSLIQAVIRLQVVKGPDVGTSYQLIPPRVRIGRGQENDVKLLDPKVSRTQAEITISTQKIIIQDKTPKASVMLNGVQVATEAEVQLRHNDVVKFGDTELRVLVFFPHPGAVQKLHTESHSNVAAQAAPFDSNASGSSSAIGTGSNRTRLYIYAGIALVVVLVLATEDDKKSSGNRRGVRLPSAVTEDVERTEQNVQELAKSRIFASVEEQQRAEEANRHFHAGFRDLQKGQYARALRSFETSRAIDPENQLAIRYFGVAERKRDEEIIYGMQEGRRFREKLMYRRCAAALEKVMIAINDKNDLRYKESEAMKKECDLLMERGN